MEEIPFFEDLRRPLYPSSTQWHEPSRPCQSEFEITCDWTISVPAVASDQVMMAAHDLQQFLADADVNLEICASDSATTAGKCIVLRTEPRPEQVPESYCVRACPGAVTVEGADDSGVMYGVFHLEDLMKFRAAPILAAGTVRRQPTLRTRILRSPMSFFHRQELAPVLEAYPDEYLQKMAHHGFNGIWLRGKLHEMVKVPVFPEFGKNAECLIADLNELVQRAGRYGIRVYFFFNEPLALPEASDFWRKYPHLKGQPYASEEAFGLCTSTPEVQEFLREGMKYLFSQIPGLAGVILVTASEFHTHCFSHLSTHNRPREQWQSEMVCERCRQRTPQDVIGEVVRCISDGVRACDPAAEVIVWNWSWDMYEDDPQPGVIEALPPDVCVMGDFERGGERVTDGFRHLVDEYSLSYVGPSERFQGTAAAARRREQPVYAKLQIGVTHEIATVPNFPVYRKLAEKFVQLREHKVSGAMESWNFGNILSLNTEVANWFSWTPAPDDIDGFLTQLAARDFGKSAAAGFARAWRLFSQAADHYPFSIPLVYWGPQQFGPAFPLFFEKIDRHMPIPWLLSEEITYDTHIDWMQYTGFGDQIANYLGPFTAEKLVSCFDNLIEEWEQGLESMRSAIADVPARLKQNADREYAVAAAVMSQFTTVRNVTEFTHLRNRWYEEPPAAERRTLLQRLLTIAEDEIGNSAACKTFIRSNRMLGFHGEAFGYDYTPAKIDAKIAAVEEAIKQIRQELARC